MGWGGLGVTALLAGCQCNPCAPVRECVEPAPVGEYLSPAPVMECKPVCPPKIGSCTRSTTTVISRDSACPALPPVGEITVARNSCSPTKMVFVSVRPSDDRYYNPDTRNFERPWPWGPYSTGFCR